MKTNNICPYLVGITGGFGTGKSTVGRILGKLDLCVIDTDDIVKEILDKKNEITIRIVREFSDEVLNAKSASEYIKRLEALCCYSLKSSVALGDRFFRSGAINKKKLAKIVFYNDFKRKKLERLIHPEVNRRLNKLIRENKNEETIFVLVPLLFEANWHKRFNEVWCVTCKKEIRIQRLLEKGFKKSEIKARTHAQMPLKKKAHLADFVVDNSGSIRRTRKQVKELVQSIHNSHLFFCK